MNTIAATPLSSIAELLKYPEGDFLIQLAQAATEDAEVREFREELAQVGVDGLQELYTMTFDLNPMATLEVGWHVWGEQYERGRFLADLRGLQARCRMDAGTELPDHLTVLLPLLDCLDASQAAGLIENVDNALTKILKTLDQYANPYRHLIRAARTALEERRS